MTSRTTGGGWTRASAVALLAATIPTLLSSPARATSTVVDVIDTSAWTPPSPDPSGVAYLRRSGRFVVVDSEVDETPSWNGVNVWLLDAEGTVLRSWSVEAFSLEPADVAARGRRLYICDDDADAVSIVRRGSDRRFGTHDDVVASFPTAGFGATDPEGIAYADGVLYLADGANGGGGTIYRIDPGPNGRFEDTGGDDVIDGFTLDGLGLDDPEGIAASGGSLYVVSRSGPDRVIVRMTLEGDVLETISVAGSGIDRPSGIAVVPRDDGLLETFVADRNVDNAVDGGENDGLLYHLLSG